MFLTSVPLPRRTFLRSVGAAVALPFLEAMVPVFKASAASAAPLRFAATYLPQGFVMDQWTPKEVGSSFACPRILQPLEPFRNQLVIVSGLDGAPNGGTGTHATGPASYLTGAIPKRTEGNDIYDGISIDQVIAKQIGQETLFPSIELATEDFSGSVGACENGYSCLYMNTIAWSSPTTPLPMEINPRTVFERLFGGTGTLQERLRRMRQNRSILDAVMTDAARLQNGLGAGDRQRVADYLDNIREIERRIQKAEQQHDQTVEAPAVPAGIPDDFGEHVGMLLDLLKVAFHADLTRVGTFMIAREIHMRSYPELGAPEGHHTLSHHAYNPGLMGKFAAVNAYHTQLFAKFVKSLHDTPDGDGTLLDHTMLLFGSGMSWGTTHDMHRLPLAVVGGGNGQIHGGRHLTHPPDTPAANLLLTLAHKAGAALDAFGLSTATVDL